MCNKDKNGDLTSDCGWCGSNLSGKYGKHSMVTKVVKTRTSEYTTAKCSRCPYVE